MRTPSVHCTSGFWSHFPLDSLLDTPLRSLNSCITARPMQASSCTQHCYCCCFFGYNVFSHAEHQRIDAFKLQHQFENLRVPWTARKSNQSILKEVNPEYSLEGLILKLKLQCFGHLMRRANSLEKILMLGKIEGRRIRG